MPVLLRPNKSEWTTWNESIAIWGKECVIWFAPRPHYCDRGNWLVHIEAAGTLARDLDAPDLWPRYYFDLDRAKLEVEAWLKKRGQWLKGEAP